MAMSSSLENPSLLLLRNKDELIAGDILVVNFERDGFVHKLRALNPNSNITAFSYNIADVNSLNPNDNISAVCDTKLPDAEFDLIIYFYPKSKPEASMMFDNIRSVANAQTRLLVVGDNKSGVKSAEKQLDGLADAVYKLESAKHCVLFEFNGLHRAEKFDIDNYKKQFVVKSGTLSFPVISVPGVFNHGSLDLGTALLLEELKDSHFDGPVLDFGCGAGVISAFVTLNNKDVEPTALDVNALAIYATKQTFSINGINGKTLLSDGLAEVKDTYHAIISNPPFHTGTSTDYSISANFFAGAPKHLTKQGRLLIVANSFLKYQPQLEANFSQVDIPKRNNKFCIYSCS